MLRWDTPAHEVEAPRFQQTAARFPRRRFLIRTILSFFGSDRGHVVTSTRKRIVCDARSLTHSPANP